MSDKLELGFRYPCDGPGRGGTCQISPYDHVFLAIFWMYNCLSLFGSQAVSQCFSSYVFMTYVCVIYWSLFTHSSVSYVSLCYTLFCISSIVISFCHQNWVQMYSMKIDMFISAYISSFKLSKGVQQGLNVSYLIHLYKVKMSYLNNCSLQLAVYSRL